jgi:hypothetical protein
MKKKWIWAAGAATAFVIVAFIALRFGGQLAAPFLDSRSGKPDSLAASAPAPDSALATLASSDTLALVTRVGPFVIDGRSYTFQILRDTGQSKGPLAARRVEVVDETGRVVYDENLFLRSDSTSSESWIEFAPYLLEDASGRARGFTFSYAWFPSAPGSGAAFNIVAPRGDSLAVLTPSVIGYYGNAGALPPGNAPQSRRLLPRNRLAVESSNGWFDSVIDLRVDFDCTPQSMSCVRVDLPDSVAGLARFAIKTSPRVKPDTIVTIEVYPSPHSATVERIAIPPGQEAEILGGAGKVYFERTPGLFLSADDQWVEIRINGKRGWITGAQSFRAIGLQQAG